MGELIFSIINTVLLIILFFYQKNKNKTLQDRIEKQNELLNESKNLIDQQSSAVDNQAKVVSSALEYANNVDIEKLRSLISSEISAEYEDELKSIKEEHANDIEQLENELKKKYGKFIAIAINKSIERTTKLFSIPLVYFIIKMDEYDPLVREGIFHKIGRDDKELEEFLRNSYETGKAALEKNSKEAQ